MKSSPTLEGRLPVLSPSGSSPVGATSGFADTVADSVMVPAERMPSATVPEVSPIAWWSPVSLTLVLGSVCSPAGSRTQLASGPPVANWLAGMTTK